jgi:hypothetical protein
MQETQKQLAANPNKPVKFPTEIGPLRNATVTWVQKAYAHFKAHPEIVKQVSTNTIFVVKNSALTSTLPY